jgi:hypothetical protein
VAFKKKIRGELTGREATFEEVLALIEELCGLVDRGKYDKAAERLTAWLLDAGLSGAGLLTVVLVINVAQACVDHGVRVDGLDRRVPQITGVAPSEALLATVHAQDLVMRILERVQRGEEDRPTADELAAVWEDERFGALVVLYYLQCLATAAHLGRVTGFLPARDSAHEADQEYPWGKMP